MIYVMGDGPRTIPELSHYRGSKLPSLLTAGAFVEKTDSAHKVTPAGGVSVPSALGQTIILVHMKRKKVEGSVQLPNFLTETGWPGFSNLKH